MCREGEFMFVGPGGLHWSNLISCPTCDVKALYRENIITIIAHTIYMYVYKCICITDIVY